jgi:exopolyphosphatase/guanosine-5'-triphosphate,3'-diphosphate pyrophosphatase
MSDAPHTSDDDGVPDPAAPPRPVRAPATRANGRVPADAKPPSGERSSGEGARRGAAPDNAVVRRAACLMLPERMGDARLRDGVDDPAPARICVIDLGTNSFHAIIVDVYPNGSFAVVDRLKEMVRMGEGGLTRNRLREAAIERGLEALKRIHLLATGWGAREFMAFATSAIREATNGGAFIDRVRHEVGLRIRAISGQREAELIFKGVQRAVSMRQPTLVVDIGGGSVEFIVTPDGQEVALAVSLKLGAARMSERFVTTDPISPAELAALNDHYRQQLVFVFAAARDVGVRSVVASSGTAKALARVTLGQHGGDPDASVFKQDINVTHFRRTMRQIIASTADERHAIGAVSAKRVDQIGAGAALMAALVDELPVERLRISPNALREGMVVHYMEENYRRLRLLAPFNDVRRRSVYEIGFRFKWEEAHVQHVAATALMLYDACRPRHAGPAADRELLEYAALLHDIGYHISHTDHQRHGQYLVEHAEMHGFSSEDVAVLACCVGFHKEDDPSETNPTYARLDDVQRRRVRQLTSILRVAEALDRSHFQNVTALATICTAVRLTIRVETKGDPQLEVWAAQAASTLFEAEFSREVVVEAGPVG